MTNILMQLRTCCNHPYLLQRGVEAACLANKGQVSREEILELMVSGSGKLALLDKMTSKLVQAGHRLLIYSQFTTVLNVLEDWLIGRKWGYQRIDGLVGKNMIPLHADMQFPWHSIPT